MKSKVVLLVDDDPSIQKLLKAALEKNGYTTMPCSSGEAALEKLEQNDLDAVILDVVLPNMDGWDVLKWIRNYPSYKHLPVIMLTCKDSEIETVLGLEMGADDYLSKPVRYHELMARLKKAFKKNEGLPNCTKMLCIHGIEIDHDSRAVYLNKVLLPLTYREFELLTLLVKNPGKVFTRDHLLDLLWHDEQFLETRTVDVHIRRLRKKLQDHGGNPDIIETIRSIGYRMISV
ncbi:response regulator with CheY-like receiver domain and winged-helix DNA-binding domain [Desulfosporosinus orientis DSM 765]|uniref:Stage 0 sporulation protein A homolog n=1 Tax=Desulfosporosinus orientis (strain ATCC 19365 / DSM 765 / NCIMB 8382 / VKM B-1628 / Singapore I) TaxID=768706 RepID=G7W9M7_DESOD|nr:response regulator transcription factor [Desulfosporosinus orientis]AET69944.1 response regulator with CheY-like receiver domain and winged-helix DNA-binding domain [Desulfosporosinus orientis DSM 765]